ncbi:MAG: MprA protease, GlyGly-CTERM protein-sorting domain-containing form [Oscillatoriales cyanobacterium]|nr:MAG: MprA protease, GlyGly-CTERM protein-sorting domain-containing form [Oscillatoriales cyanobacterium]TAH22270.1 MAG: MprA protease, GlyGly-CTERM protein-sorting domain-containing form [Oscillatoriales cyanobacterium]
MPQHFDSNSILPRSGGRRPSCDRGGGGGLRSYWSAVALFYCGKLGFCGSN